MLAWSLILIYIFIWTLPAEKAHGTKGHSQLLDSADQDTTFVGFEKRLPQPEINSTRRIHVEIRFNPA